MLRSPAVAAKAELLNKVGLFSDCSKQDLHRVARRCREQRVPSGTEIVAQGSVGDRFYVLAEGLASVHVDGQRVASISPGSFFGEMALIEHEVRSATVTAELPCRLLVIDEADFAAVRAIPSVTEKVLHGLAERLRHANAPAGEQS